jgi:3-phenylpropionate/trans-cinnamate dioxygenase ferredoxin reductase subunit
MSTVDRIVVAGAGECGARTASELRSRGFTGSITLIGEERHLPYERPPLSKDALVSADEPDLVVTMSHEALAAASIDLVAPSVVDHIERDDRVVRLHDGGTIPYDRLLLATGARARTLPIEGGELARTLRSYDDALALRAELTSGVRLVVIGAGFIGLEVAASARRRGCTVTVLEAATRPLERAVPAPLAEMVVKRHLAAGVHVWCDVRPIRIETSSDGLLVGLDGGHRPVAADVVLAGVGAVPNIELAEAAGLACDNGIAVDATLRTSDPAIYAAGDCCSAIHELFGGRRVRLESWRNAHDQAVVAAANLLGANEPLLAVPWFWSDQYDLGLQVAGLADAATSWVVRERVDGVAVHFGLDDDGRLVTAGAVGRGTSVAKDIRIAEMLIVNCSRPDPRALTNPALSLRSILIGDRA